MSDYCISYVSTIMTHPLFAPRVKAFVHSSSCTQIFSDGIFSIHIQMHANPYSSISRFLVRSSRNPIPDDARKLRISRSAFRFLFSHFEIPAAFVAALCRHYQTCGTGYRNLSGTATSSASWDYWCLLPVRVQVPCRDDAQVHTKSTAGSNQMDPFHYIHLSDAHVDIRGSHIGLFVRQNRRVGTTTAVVVNFLDGRWSRIVDEPIVRVKEAIKSRGDGDAVADPSFVHLIYLSSVIRWWNNVLLSFNQQLIAHVGSPLYDSSTS